MQVVTVPQVMSLALSLAGVVVALVLLITVAHGRSRVAGIVGTALMLLGTLSLSGHAYGWLLHPFLGQVSEDTMILILATQTVIGSVLTGAGVVLLTYAIVVTDLPTKT